MAPFHQFIKIGQLNSPNSPDLSNFPISPTLGVGLPIKIKVFGSVLDFDLECLSHSLCPCFACFPFCFLLTVYYLLFSICLICCFEFMQFESETACLPNWHSERRRTKLSLKFKLYFLLRYFYIFLFERFIFWPKVSMQSISDPIGFFQNIRGKRILGFIWNRSL